MHFLHSATFQCFIYFIFLHIYYLYMYIVCSSYVAWLSGVLLQLHPIDLVVVAGQDQLSHHMATAALLKGRCLLF